MCSVFRDLTIITPADKVTAIVALCKQLLGGAEELHDEGADQGGGQAAGCLPGHRAHVSGHHDLVPVCHSGPGRQLGLQDQAGPPQQGELEWWVGNLHTVDMFPIYSSHSTTVLDYSVSSDTSGVSHDMYSMGHSPFGLVEPFFETRISSFLAEII